MGLNSYKYIITSGCSYGGFADALRNPLYSIFTGNINTEIKEIYSNLNITSHIESSNNLVFIGANCESQSASYIADSTIYVTSQLIKLGVSPNNIYVFCEWTQVSRTSIHPFDWVNINFTSKSKTPKIKILSYPEVGKADYEVIVNAFNIQTFKEYAGAVSISSRTYINPSSTDSREVDDEFNRLLKYGIEYENSIPIEEKVDRYINNILSVQHFLKSYGIDYNFIFMQGSLANWYKKENKFISHKIEYLPKYKIHNYSVENKKLIIDDSTCNQLGKESYIENICRFIKSKFNLIDLKNVWFYETPNIKRGGMDEWAIDQFGPTCMVSEELIKILFYNNTPRSGFDFRNDILTYGNHPNLNLYKLIWNEAAINCKFFKLHNKYLDRIKEMFFEDQESSNITEHGITISKNAYYNISI